jgi:uncharacterized membrane protein YeaQ/YmgE (transglycosylase-associated protein family)
VVAGWFGSRVVGGEGGLFRYLIAGMLGAFVGAWAIATLGIHVPIPNFWVREIVIATGGAIIVILGARTLS